MRLSEELSIPAKARLSETIVRMNTGCRREVPPLKESQRWVREMVNLLFPIRENIVLSAGETESRLESSKVKLNQLLMPLQPLLDKPYEDISEVFFSELTNIFDTLVEDAKGFESCDPAAESLEEVIVGYPGFFALAVYRIAHVLYQLKVPFLPRIISEYAHSKTGIDIHPGAKIGKRFFIDHGTGIVIGETTKIGDNVKIYQGVTLGAIYVDKDMSDTKRHPTIEDNVILYSGSTILGGNTIVGRDTIIGGNVFLTKSVDPGSLVYHENKIRVREKEKKKHPLNFII